ncbi:type IV conjugative transfer system protein TraL [Algicola sagamiensis]|uniref:type IV conjugative transfer system protein TraL n=1 Tax=Algicola sagamiensis TaxID=163869 RepID=UPI0003798A7B|nr:type IV conjugative transfer system protein TraL [Algicola sagamiensis]
MGNPSNDLERYWVPRTLDAGMLFFVWEADTALIFLIPIFIGMSLGAVGLLLGVMAGWLLARLYVRLKDEGGKGLILKLFFWFLPSQSWGSKRNPSHIREFLGN